MYQIKSWKATKYENKLVVIYFNTFQTTNTFQNNFCSAPRGTKCPKIPPKGLKFTKSPITQQIYEVEV